MSCAVADRIVVSPSDPTASVSSGWCQLLSQFLAEESLPADGSCLQGKFVGPKLVLISREPDHANTIGKDTQVEIAVGKLQASVNANWERDVRKLVTGYDPILNKLLTACKKVFCSSGDAASSESPCLLRAPRLWQILGSAGSGKSHMITSYIQMFLNNILFNIFVYLDVLNCC